MLRRFGTSTLVVLLVVAACGGDQASPPPAVEPDVPGTTQPSVASVPSTASPAEDATRIDRTVPPSTESQPPSASTTIAEQQLADLAVLRPGGLGSVDFGTPADEALEDLSALLGPPDRTQNLWPIGEGCVEGAGWLDCLRDLRVINEGRLVVWATYGLDVAMVDTSRQGWPGEITPLQFGDWHATVPLSDVRLVTDAGLYAGMTVGELRQMVPSVRFTYNEGTLDSFYVTLGDGGAYWGRLDWDPDTAIIERWDVSAMQTALNEQGADLAVDGEWGPRSEAAWLRFMTEQGVEPSTLAAKWPLWLTPEFGEALGFPPDIITVGTLEPRPATETAAAWYPILRADGLGRFRFGEPANDLVAELEAMLGPAAEDKSYTPDGTRPFDIFPMGYWAAYELRIVTWAEPDLRLVLNDIGLVDGAWTPTPGMLTLLSWATSSPQLTFAGGLAVGSSMVALRAQHPQIGFGTFDVCESEYHPAAFSETPPLWRGLRGTTNWDWVSDLQLALNERSASLAVDGEYGPRTRVAVAAFEEESGFTHADGMVDPEVAEALDLRAPDNARITGLEAGSPGSC